MVCANALRDAQDSDDFPQFGSAERSEHIWALPVQLQLLFTKYVWCVKHFFVAAARAYWCRCGEAYKERNDTKLTQYNRSISSRTYGRT